MKHIILAALLGATLPTTVLAYQTYEAGAEWQHSGSFEIYVREPGYRDGITEPTVEVVCRGTGPAVGTPIDAYDMADMLIDAAAAAESP